MCTIPRKTLLHRAVIPALILTFPIFGALAAGPATPSSVELRGYGKVTANIQPDTSEFHCQSEAKADILLGKLLADMFWDAGSNQTEKTVQAGNHQVTMHVWQPFGAVVAGRIGNVVLVAGGADEAETLALVRKDPRFAEAAFQSKPSNPYPVYLDMYDLRAFKSYTSGSDRTDLFWPFVKKFGLGGLEGGIYFQEAPAPGVVDWSQLDCEVGAAEREKGLFSVDISTGDWPRWEWNEHPGYIGQDSSNSVSEWSVDDTQLNEGLGLSQEQRKETSMKFLKDVMLRYRNSPALGGWQLYCGDYIFESYYSKLFQGIMDYSPTGEEGFRQWLRTTRGYSLEKVGERWYGDPSHFHSWSEVTVPEDINSFFGNLNDTCFRIQDGWSWHKAQPDDWTAPKADDPAWVPLQMPPAKEMFLFPYLDFYKAVFDPSDWLGKNAGKDIYLVCNLNASGWNDYDVWLNGDSLGTFKSKVDPYAGPIALKLTGLLRPGKNCLILKSLNRMHGPVFLTTTQPVGYPYLGKNRNAQYFDLVEWQLDALTGKIGGALEYARSIDPNRPFVICATSDTVKEAEGDAVARIGGSIQNTGCEANFESFNSRFGYADGFYESCEPSAIPFTPGEFAAKDMPYIDRMLSWMLYNAAGAHMLFWNPEPYIELEKKTGWFTQNQRLIQLVGKFLPEKPKIGLFFSSESSLLEYDTGHSLDQWNIGRGELYSAHYDNVYISKSMLARGVADDYPVLFDTDTRFMGEDTIQALKRYVENGGTFVALQSSGRNGLEEPDTWPISQLTGYKVLAEGKKGKITFEKNLPIFKGWEGKTFEGEGSALDFKSTQSATNVSVALDPAAPETVALAKWDDGTVAVGMRRIGKGRVIVLGSTFWRYGSDIGAGTWRTKPLEEDFFERLFGDSGIQRTASASNPLIYARKLITKNGLQEWLMALNTTRTALKADLSMAVSEKPAQVFDVVTGEKVPFEYANGWVTIRNAEMPPGIHVRVFGMARTTLAGGVDFWWGEKTRFWKSPDVKPLVETAGVKQSNPETIPFYSWKFSPDKDGTLSKTDDWTQPGFDGSAWRNYKGGSWNLAYDDLKDYRATGLFRSLPFSIPPSWKGKEITINLAPAPGWVQPDAFYLNGQKLSDLSRPKRICVVTDQLKKDGNVISIKVTANAANSRGGGLFFSLWLEPKRILEPSISLLGAWQAVMGDWLTHQPATLPGKVTAKYIVRSFDVPADWRGRNVYVSFTPGLNSNCIMLNGQPLLTMPGLDSEDINLTPFVKFGETNRIEIWPQNTFWLNFTKGGEVGDVNLKSIDVGCETK